MRTTRWALIVAVALSCSGCTIFDRESYSLIYKKKAHLYDEPQMPVMEKPKKADGYDRDDTRVRNDLDELVAPLIPELQPFRPFAYCHLHQTTHFIESLAAVALAPVEYPVTLTGNVAYIAVEAAYRIIKAPIDALLPPTEKPTEFEERRKEQKK